MTVAAKLRYRAAMPRVLRCLAAAALACHGPDAGPTADPPTKILAAAPDPSDPLRRCGEAGVAPTDLPPALISGLERLGGGTIKPNDRTTVGTVEIHYDPNMLVSPTSVGHRAPALDLRMDQAEGKGGPWGAFLTLHPGRAQHVYLGPYRIDAQSSADLQLVSFAVSRRNCPDHATIEKTDTMLHMWLSTEAIRAHTYDVQGALLQVMIEGHPEAPRIDITNLGYRQHFIPRPDERRSFRVGAHLVTIDGVTPGPDTRFVDDRWIADGGARLHARVRIDHVPRARLPAATPATSPCGEASPTRTSLPSALAQPLGLADEVTLAVGATRTLGPLELTATEEEMPPLPGPDRKPETYRQIAVHRAGTLIQNLSHTTHAPRLDRFDRDLLRLDPDPAGGPVRARRWTAACSNHHEHPLPSAPIFVWLSTVGHTWVPIGGDANPALMLQIHADPERPSLAVAAVDAHYNQSISPDMAGMAFTLDGFLVEIVDVVAADDVRWTDNRWQTAAPIPRLHVQVRVTRT